jgi:hypothetical protein
MGLTRASDALVAEYEMMDNLHDAPRIWGWSPMQLTVVQGESDAFQRGALAFDLLETGLKLTLH